MNLQQLYYFKEIAELEHYTKASKRLNISQSSLSHSINDLEGELGVELFSHQGRNVQLTKAGELFLKYVKDSLAILEEGRQRLENFVGVDTGTISLSYISSLFHFVPALISKYFEETGRIRTCFQFNESATGSIKEHLINGASDIAFTTPFDDAPEIESVKIGESPVVLVVPKDHRFAGYDEIDLKHIANEKFITYNNSCHLRKYIDKALESVGVVPQISFESMYDSIVLSAISIGLGVAIMPKASVSIHETTVKAIKIKNALPAREVHIAWIKDRYMSPAVKNFLDFAIKNGELLKDFS